MLLQNYQILSDDQLEMLTQQMLAYAKANLFDSMKVAEDLAVDPNYTLQETSTGAIRVSSQQEIVACLPYTQYIYFNERALQVSYYEIPYEAMIIAQLTIVDNLKKPLIPKDVNRLTSLFLDVVTRDDIKIIETPPHVAVIFQPMRLGADENSRSIFSQTLEIVLDHTGLFNRQEWAKFFMVPEAKIEEWLNDKSIPSAHRLHLLYNALTNSNIPSKPLKFFTQMAALPARQVSPFGKLMLPTVMEYLSRPTFCELSNKLAKMSLEEQADYLDKLYPGNENES
jgi:hypothetical protein